MVAGMKYVRRIAEDKRTAAVRRPEEAIAVRRAAERVIHRVVAMHDLIVKERYIERKLNYDISDEWF